jgi:hypothetical protein
VHNLWNLKAFNSALYTIFMLSKVTAPLQVVIYFSDLTESVNSMASNLTAQVRNIAEVTIAVANGDLSK